MTEFKQPLLIPQDRADLLEAVARSVSKNTKKNLALNYGLTDDNAISWAAEAAYFFIINTRDNCYYEASPKSMLSILKETVGESNVTVLEESNDAVKIRLKNHVWWLARGLAQIWPGQMPFEAAHLGTNGDADILKPYPLFGVTYNFNLILPVMDELMPEIIAAALKAKDDAVSAFNKSTSKRKAHSPMPSMPSITPETSLLATLPLESIIGEAADKTSGYYLEQISGHFGFFEIPKEDGFRTEALTSALHIILGRLNALEHDWHPAFTCDDLTEAFLRIGIPKGRISKDKYYNFIHLENTICCIDSHCGICLTTTIEEHHSCIHCHGCKVKNMTAEQTAYLLTEMDRYAPEVCRKATDAYPDVRRMFRKLRGEARKMYEKVDNALKGKGIDYDCFVSKGKVSLKLEKIEYTKVELEVPHEDLDRILNEAGEIVSKAKPRRTLGVQIISSPMFDQCREDLYNQLDEETQKMNMA